MKPAVDENSLVDQFRVRSKPNYVPHGNEEEVLRAAFESKIPLIIKGRGDCAA
jgi:hypothetical protein